MKFISIELENNQQNQKSLYNNNKEYKGIRKRNEIRI